MAMPAPLFRVPTRIDTERLTLRRYTRADAEQLAEVTTRNIAHLERYMEWIKFEPQTVEQRRAWIDDVNRQFDAGEDYTLGIFLREGALVGGTGYHVLSDPDRLEIGYWIDQDHEGRGLVTETAAALTWAALGVAGDTVVDITQSPTNTRSAAVAQRLGYERQPGQAHGSFDAGQMVPGVMWWATRDTLATEPLASTPRPVAYDDDGTPILWHA